MSLKLLTFGPLFVIFGLVLTHCATPKNTTTDNTSKTVSAPNLTRAEAATRKQAISSSRYDLKMAFETKSESYTATADIHFKMENPESTFLDFKGGEIISLLINGKAVTPKIENYRINLPKIDLVSGENHVVASYKQNFSKNGRGIYRFQDPEDNKVYIWSKLEPFDANHVFPCFDQPDLKSIFSMEVTAPSDWIVVFTTLESSIKIMGDKTQWLFPDSPPMSTYLFSIHAGNYEVWKDTYNKIPLRLFARASLKKYVDAPFWFSSTKKGFKYYEKEFAYPYPFKKYDQLIVPEFSSGGMENIAAVNYSERYIPRGTASREERENLNSVLLHEMAHMWFGDLVTMNWWDDLWLNESFATFMSFNASENATEFKEAWPSFQKRGKLSAYIEDQYPTTHPVSTDVIDINATVNHFDAITYSKGASVLRQLSYYIGEKNFKKGIQNYFKEHAYTNTTLVQFIASLEKASKTDLRMWSLSWLRNSGIDTIKVTPECTGPKLSSLKFELTPPTANDRPRPHRVPITLFKSNGNKLKVWTVDDWKADGPSETVSIKSSHPCPDFVFPNATDQTYIKMSLNPDQLHWAQDHLAQISSAQARGVLWNQVYLNLRDGTIKMEDFIKLVSAQFKQEKNQNVIQQFFSYWSAIAKYMPQKTDIQLALRTKVLMTLERHFWNEIQNSKDANWKKTLLTNWARRIETDESQNQVFELLSGKIQLTNLALDQDIKWQLIQRLAVLGHPQADTLIADAKSKDTSETGFKSFLSASASKPSLKDKTKWLEEMNRPDANWSLARKQSVLYSLFPSTPKQTQLRNEFKDQFYKTMSLLDKRNEDTSYNRSYADLAPSSCEMDTIKEFEEFISKQDWNVITKKSLIIQNHENKICARIQVR